MSRTILLLVLTGGLTPLCSAGTDLSALLHEARRLASSGQAAHAAALYEQAIASAALSRTAADLCEARQSVAAQAVRTGDYTKAALHARAATVECPAAGPEVRRAWNTLGQAQLYSGSYADSARSFARVRDLAHDAADPQAEAYAWNNLGGAQYYGGLYYEAFQSFHFAERLVSGAPDAPWTAGPRRITLANQAMLSQRLGRDLEALKLYRQLRAGSGTLRPEEEAQLLANLGALYRRLGDPPKALDLYQSARALLSRRMHSDTLLSLTKNIGIVQLLELEDTPAAERSFHLTADLAVRTGNRREQMQARLYLGETLLRAGRRKEAGLEFAQAESLSRSLKTGEERWKALHGLARVAIADHRSADALAHVSEAARLIESSRASLQDSALRSDFMSDKRRVYDDAIALLTPQPHSPPPHSPQHANELLRWMERSRSRLLQDRYPAPSLTLAALQAHLDPQSALLLYWRGEARAALFWITQTAWGIEALPTHILDDSQFDLRLRDLADRGVNSRPWLARLSAELLPPHLPILNPRFTKWSIVPDGAIAAIPFEALPLPGGRALVQQASVTYLPTASLLLTSPAPGGWRMPWQPQLLALANPTAPPASSSSDLLAGDETWQPLPHAELEARSAVAALSGRATVAIGPAAAKTLLAKHAGRHSILHLATHAVSDAEDASRSRLLLSGAGGRAWDYLFRGDIAALPLANAELVTLSACETGHGRIVRGEGSQSLGNAFLLAGARATVTTLWKVDDAATAALMREFYIALGAGMSKADALRHAKLRFVHGPDAQRHPAHWAAFVLTGDGWNPLRPVASWPLLGALAAAALLALGLLVRLFSSRREKAAPR